MTNNGLKVEALSVRSDGGSGSGTTSGLAEFRDEDVADGNRKYRYVLAPSL